MEFWWGVGWVEFWLFLIEQQCNCNMLNLVHDLNDIFPLFFHLYVWTVSIFHS